MRGALLALILTIATAAGVALRDAPPSEPPSEAGAHDDPPVKVFAALDGTWVGTFVGFDAAGKELYRIRVRQTYETVNATTQRVTLEDTFADGKRITGEGENTARRDANGDLVLACVVRKSNGESVSHRGRLVRDASGEHAIVWYSRASGRVETFRETVRDDDGRAVYEINGMGRYGDTLMLMHGRYVRIPRADPVD